MLALRTRGIHTVVVLRTLKGSNGFECRRRLRTERQRRHESVGVVAFL